jgi:pyruvate/2-oxoglutarate dehydrogenase complex dihydrolipoamide dehydrogenase (E3) component
MDEHYDLCVIGAGTAGFAAAERARRDGRSVLIVSGPGDLGGTCIRRGCMPAKTLFAASERLGEVESADELGVHAPAPRADLPAIIARKRELVEYFAEDRVAELERYPLARGWARFVAHDALEVDGRRIEAERFIIATGSHIVAPPIDGLTAAEYLTSDDALELTRVPPSLAILGGGPVGCEFAQYFARLGARVTLLQEEPTLLRQEDEDVARAVEAALVAEGIGVRTGCVVRRCARAGAERVLSLCGVDNTGDAGRASELRVAAIVLASNRVANVDRLALDAAGVARSAHGIAVDAFLATTNPRVYAAGDVLGRRFLVHTAEYAGKLAAHNAFTREPRAADFDRWEAHAVYTQPQVAVAGLTERVCRARGLAVRVRRHPFRDVGKAVVAGDPEGFIKMIADGDGTILGIALVGDGASELIGEGIALIEHRAKTRDVAGMPHLHPTMSEIYARVAENFESQECEVEEFEAEDFEAGDAQRVSA